MPQTLAKTLSRCAGEGEGATGSVLGTPSPSQPMAGPLPLPLGGRGLARPASKTLSRSAGEGGTRAQRAWEGEGATDSVLGRGLACALALLLAGCAIDDRIGTAAAIARPARLAASDVATATFTLRAWSRIGDPAAPLAVYIEGDGLAWLSPTEPSLDPTPMQPVGLQLAALDGGSNVLYLARPCQYVLGPKCRETYWTERTYSPEVIAAMDAAVSRFAGRAGIHLVGYSGGGAVAVLLAARRTDVLSLRTVAGNLDHAAFTRHHQVSPMTESLNPADSAAAIARIPQIHYIGGRDSVVPRLVADSFARRAGDESCITLVPVPAASHDEGWTGLWKTAASRLPECRR